MNRQRARGRRRSRGWFSPASLLLGTLVIGLGMVLPNQMETAFGSTPVAVPLLAAVLHVLIAVLSFLASGTVLLCYLLSWIEPRTPRFSAFVRLRGCCIEMLLSPEELAEWWAELHEEEARQAALRQLPLLCWQRVASLRLNIGGWLLLGWLASFGSASALATPAASPLFALCCWFLLALHLLVMVLTLSARGVLMVRRHLHEA